jgi:hypothetical protein
VLSVTYLSGRTLWTVRQSRANAKNGHLFQKSSASSMFPGATYMIKQPLVTSLVSVACK